MQHRSLDFNTETTRKRLIVCTCDAYDFLTFYEMYKNIQKDGVGWKPLKKRLEEVGFGFPLKLSHLKSSLGPLEFPGGQIRSLKFYFKRLNYRKLNIELIFLIKLREEDYL